MTDAEIVYTSETPVPCPDCQAIHGTVDEWWCCPDHGHEYQWTGADEWQDHFTCPEPDCKHGRWVG